MPVLPSSSSWRVLHRPVVFKPFGRASQPSTHFGGFVIIATAGEISCVRYFTMSVRRLDAGVARGEFWLSKRCATARILSLFGIGRSTLLREGAFTSSPGPNPKAVEIERFGSLISSML